MQDCRTQCANLHEQNDEVSTVQNILELIVIVSAIKIIYDSGESGVPPHAAVRKCLVIKEKFIRYISFQTLC